jgi:hypothetical protein
MISSVTLTFNASEIKKSLQEFVNDVSAETFKDAKANTPYRTGNARRGWIKKDGRLNSTIENKVPYIERLEAGASRQAPKGIIGPTLTQVKGKYK